MSGHSERKHAPLSASARARWSKCGPSFRLGRDLPEPPATEDAAEGTRRHEWLEFLLRNAVTNAAEYIDVVDVANGTPAHALTKEGAAAVQVALELTYKLLEPAEQTELYIETAFKFPGMDPDLGGTGDVCVINKTMATLDIVDFKNGRWLVDAIDNKQLGQYAVGAQLAFKPIFFRRIRIHVVQPKDYENPVKLWEIDAARLFDERLALEADAARAKDPKSPFVPGEHCRFCKVSYHQKCTVVRELAQKHAAEGFKPITDRAELKARLDALPAIKQYVEDLEQYARDEIKAGRGDFGKKLVAFQKRTAWAGDPAVIIAHMAKAWPTLDPYKPRDLRSPKEIEQETGAAFYQIMGPFLRKTVFGTQLVDSDDPRPSLDHGGEGFAPVK